jgi:Domain of unknown function (DUF4873)
MNTYDGPAVIICPTTEIRVQAHLRTTRDTGGLMSWGGSVASLDGDLFGAMDYNDHLKIQLPDGREAPVSITHVQTGSRGTSPATIRGNGEPPYCAAA